MLLPVLPTCRQCELSTLGCKTVGIPSLPLQPLDPAKPVVVFMGHQPGRDEDSRGEIFVGPSGQLLRKCFIGPLGLESDCNVVLMNLVRCWPMIDKPRPSHINACHSHLAADLLYLSSLPGPHFLVLLGSEAVKAILNKTLSASLRSNGSLWSPPWLPVSWSVFCTYHPAFLLSKRNPNAIHACSDHLQLLLDRLNGRSILRSSPLLVPASRPVLP